MSEANKILIRAAAESNVGNARGNNEDNVYFNGDYITPRNIGRPFAIKTGDYTDVNIFAVIDGMGRNNTGSFASLVAATKLDNLADRISFDPDATPDDAVLEYMQETNDLIRDQRRETGGVRTASTMALLIIEHGNAHVYNVGDSRVYLYRDKQLVKMTRDHVAVEGQKSVALTEEGIRHGRITKFLGMNSREGKMEPYRAKPFKVKKGDKFLVCSDGVTDQLDEDEITVCLAKRKDPFGHTNELMALSMSDDSDDNVSAIVVEAIEPGIHITQNMIMVMVGCLIMAFGVAVGFVFGWLEGAVLCLIGSILASSLVFLAVRKWGVKLVELFFPREKILSYSFLQNEKKLNLLSFVLFLVPGTPKDMLTYILGLTPMKLTSMLVITTLARLPAVLCSTITGSLAKKGSYTAAIITYGVTMVIAGVCVWWYRKISRQEKEQKANEK